VIIPPGMIVKLLAGEYGECHTLEVTTGARLEMDPTATFNAITN